VFVRPELTADVEFMGWTEDDVMRAPSYKGLTGVPALAPAPAAAPASVARPAPVVRGGKGRVEVEVDGRTLSLSNLDKVLYPAAGFTKGQVIDFYTRIAPTVLPHLEGRMLTLKRYPNGVEGPYFYEKNCPAHRPDWVRTATVAMDTKQISFCLCEDAATLVWLANLADLELHTSMAVASDPDTRASSPSTSTRGRRRRSSSARASRCGCTGCSSGSGWGASRRRRARRGCRSTCRSTRRA
jgi:bifunctional non-homologous end joining protein LigD